MRHVVTLLLAGGLLFSMFPQEIFRTNLEGTSVLSFSSGEAIDMFTVTGCDSEGYVYLVAHAGSESGEIMRTCCQGIGFQGFTFPEGEYLTGFDTRGPDTEGYVYLVVLGSEGSTGDILRTKWEGCAVHAYYASRPVTSIGVCGPDENGYVYLAAGTAEEEPEPAWTEAPDFALAEIANPCTDLARIRYSLARPCRVSIKIYDASGRSISTVVGTEQPAGFHELLWDATDGNGKQVNAGVYFITMDAGSFKATRKLVVVK